MERLKGIHKKDLWFLPVSSDLFTRGTSPLSLVVTLPYGGRPLWTLRLPSGLSETLPAPLDLVAELLFPLLPSFVWKVRMSNFTPLLVLPGIFFESRSYR